MDASGIKVAEHTGGEPVANPLSTSREIDQVDLRQNRKFLQRHLPGVSNRLSHHAPCLYTMSPDGHFFVDRHPGAPQVAFAAGLSGHGFKLAPALGEILADLATEGATPHPINFLRADRR